MKNKPTTLYRYFNSSNELLYVGISKSPMQRLEEHKYRAAWFESAESVKFEKFDTRDAALKAESIAIKNENPIFNIQNKPKQPKKITEEKPLLYGVDNDFLILWAVGDTSCIEHCIYTIGRIHKSFPLAFELEDDSDCDSQKESLPKFISDYYSHLVDKAFENGATASQIGAA